MNKIIHIADLHIGSSQSRSAEYRAVFDELGAYINERARDALVVICGDIFHWKVKYSATDISDFIYLLKILTRKNKVLIIPGNHDIDLGAGSAKTIDLILPLMRYFKQNVLYIRDTCEFEYGGHNFVHLSVLDQFKSCADVDKVLASVKDLKTKIILWHGMINGARFGHDNIEVNGSALSVEHSKRAKLILAGDIHQMQFISPNCAYPGSMILQNFGESGQKGFIEWDTNKVAGEFHPLNVKSDNINHGLITIDATNLTDAQLRDYLIANPPRKNAASVRLIDNSTKPRVDIVKEWTTRVDVIKRVKVEKRAINISTEVVASLRAMLREKGATDEQVANITSDYSALISSVKNRNWYIKNLAWSNMFKYGPDNYIDFDILTGKISGVIAPNCSGKSSIIDIICVLLFNMQLYSREGLYSTIHKGAKRMCARITFVSGATTYYLERATDHSKNNTYNLRELSTVDNTYKDITEHSITAIYAKMKELVGTFEQFQSTSLYNNLAYDITTVSNTESIKILSELLGLEDNKAIIARLESEIKAANKEIGMMPRDISSATVDNSELNNYNTELENINKNIADARATHDEHNAKLLKINSALSGVIPLNVITKNIADLEKNIDIIEKKIAQYDAQNVALVEDAPYIPVPKKIIEPNFTQVDPMDIEILAREQEHILQLCPQAINDPIKYKKMRDNIVLSDIFNLDKDNIASNIARINGTINKINDKLKTRVLADEGETVLKTLRDRKVLIEQRTKFKFNDECGDCNTNIKLLAEDLTEISDEIERSEAKFAQIKENNIFIKKCNVALTKLRDELKIEETNMKKILDHEQAASLDEIINYCAQYQDATGKIRAAKSELAMKKEYDDYVEQARKHDQYNLYMAHKKCAEYKAQLNTLRAEQSKSEKMSDLLRLKEKYGAKLGAEMQKIMDLSIKKGIIDEKKNMLQKQVDNIAKYSARYKELQARLDELTLYRECISSKRLRLDVINNNFRSIINEANTLLEIVGANFVITFNAEDARLDLFLREAHKDGTHFEFPLIKGSGYQRFISSIALRMALTSVTPSTAGFIIIDEGFGCMDNVNIMKLNGLFAGMKDLYQYIFIISHIDSVKASLEIPLNIITDGDTSYICNGTPPRPTILPAPANDNVAIAQPILAPKADKMKCECGAIVSVKSIRVHLTSKKHKDICNK